MSPLTFVDETPRICRRYFLPSSTNSFRYFSVASKTYSTCLFTVALIFHPYSRPREPQSDGESSGNAFSVSRCRRYLRTTRAMLIISGRKFGEVSRTYRFMTHTHVWSVNAFGLKRCGRGLVFDIFGSKLCGAPVWSAQCQSSASRRALLLPALEILI